jgi:hypothetical protein
MQYSEDDLVWSGNKSTETPANTTPSALSAAAARLTGLFVRSGSAVSGVSEGVYVAGKDGVSMLGTGAAVTASEAVYVLTSGGKIELASAGKTADGKSVSDASYSGGSGASGTSGTSGSSSSSAGTSAGSGGSSQGGVSIITEKTYTDPVVFKGAGYGHGIGMPQAGAVEMAKQGFSAEDILKFYYTGIEIRTI